jgi:hypothetical protein
MEPTALASIDRALAHITEALNSGCTEVLYVSQFLTLYLEWGLSEIVRLDEHERLDLSLMDDERGSAITSSALRFTKSSPSRRSTEYEPPKLKTELRSNNTMSFGETIRRWTLPKLQRCYPPQSIEKT